MERTSTNMKCSGILLQMSWLPTSKTADIRSSTSGIHEKRKVDDIQPAQDSGHAESHGPDGLVFDMSRSFRR